MPVGAEGGYLLFEVENLLTVSPKLQAVCPFNETESVVAHGVSVVWCK